MFEYTAPENLLEDKTILITGASDGIGKICACTFADHGARVILLGRNQEKLEAVYDQIEALNPGKTVIHPLDFISAMAADYQTLAQSLNEQFECLDGLIHNAALLGAMNPIEFYPERDWTELMQVNINAAFLSDQGFTAQSQSLDRCQTPVYRVQCRSRRPRLLGGLRGLQICCGGADADARG